MLYDNNCAYAGNKLIQYLYKLYSNNLLIIQSIPILPDYPYTKTCRKNFCCAACIKRPAAFILS